MSGRDIYEALARLPKDPHRIYNYINLEIERVEQALNEGEYWLKTRATLSGGWLVWDKEDRARFCLYFDQGLDDLRPVKLREAPLHVRLAAYKALPALILGIRSHFNGFECLANELKPQDEPPPEESK